MSRYISLDTKSNSKQLKEQGHFWQGEMEAQRSNRLWVWLIQQPIISSGTQFFSISGLPTILSAPSRKLLLLITEWLWAEFGLPCFLLTPRESRGVTPKSCPRWIRKNFSLKPPQTSQQHLTGLNCISFFFLNQLPPSLDYFGWLKCIKAYPWNISKVRFT